MIWLLIRKLLFCLPPEFAHAVGGFGLRLLGAWPGSLFPFIKVRRSEEGRNGSSGVGDGARAKAGKRRFVFCGRALVSPLGLAAGFDKNAEYVAAIARLGFGFMEVGTVTPVGQMGNPKPRLFRLPESEALINRLGFNGEGALAVQARLQALAAYRGRLFPIGVNIGKNKSTPLEMAHLDYERALRLLYGVADFFVVNLSSPNTPGLRDLQGEEYLRPLLQVIRSARDQCASKSAGDKRPLLVKISPDMDREGCQIAVETALAEGFDGVVATNTTIRRDLNGVSLLDKNLREVGGLSGAPLQNLAKQHIVDLRNWLGPKPTLISVGGLADEFDAEERLALGADLLEVYTKFIYAGPSFPKQIAQHFT